jgi:hypothetical protein
VFAIMENIQPKGGDSRIKAAESSDFVDDQGHAKVNDPVEPPARFAPKGRGSLDGSIDPLESVTTPGGGTKQMDPNSILTRLYDPDRMQKPAIWKFIKLGTSMKEYSCFCLLFPLTLLSFASPINSCSRTG